MNLTSAVELSCSAGAGTCTVLGTTRALGMHHRAKEHGVRTTTVYQVDTILAWQCETCEKLPTHMTWNHILSANNRLS